MVINMIEYLFSGDKEGENAAVQTGSECWNRLDELFIITLFHNT